MPIEVTVQLPHIELIQPLLSLCPALTAGPGTDETSYRVTDLEAIALAEDRYGSTTTLTDEASALLAAHAAEEVLWFADLDLPDRLAASWNYALGVWRLDLVRYLKAMARAGQAEIVLRYAHERGDWLYELAGWTLDYRDPAAGVEELSVVDFDGGPARWQAAARRVNGGAVQATYERFSQSGDASSGRSGR